MKSANSDNSKYEGLLVQEKTIIDLLEELQREKESHQHTNDELVRLQQEKIEWLQNSPTSDVKRHFRAILENSTDGVALISSSGKMPYASPAAKKMFGFSPTDNPLDFEPHTYTHPDDLEMVLGEIHRTMSDPGYIPTIQYRFRNKDGEWKWIESVISNQIEDPAVGALVINFRDIHDKMLIIQELQEAKENAEKLNRLKDSFISAMSHEIRTPLTGIIGMVNVISDSLDEEANEELSPFFESIHRSSKRLISTIEDILNFSLLQSGNYSCDNCEVNINQVISDVINDLKPQAEEKSLTLTHSISKENLIVLANFHSLYTVIAKLTGNAIKFTKEGKVKIEVEENYEQDQVIIKVSDTGVGISEEYQHNLFNPYTQEDNGYGRSFEGLGLGLPIAKKLLDLMNAAVKVESEKNFGTVFTLYFKKI